MELDYRNEFKTRANTAHTQLLKNADVPTNSAFEHRRLTYKALGVKEAAEKVYEVFEATPVDTDEANAIEAFRAPVKELIAAAKSNLNVYRNHMAPGAAEDEIHCAEATLDGYELALYYLYTR